MFPTSFHDLIMTMSTGLFIMGVISVGIGLYILVARVLTGDLQAIAKQMGRLGQKGITDDIAGLVGNASSLVDTLNQLLKTTSGIGTFVIMIGLVLLLGAYYLLLQAR
ncbi:MAG: hypothetical protein GYA17_11320 [Chloroflexi bacterium]|jgi:hypothetical protein|nr:hypothetical protein [Anaerolineaceae bacterium]NMB88942.1 hypothetical protein [Chloroflexota bacterium]